MGHPNTFLWQLVGIDCSIVELGLWINGNLVFCGGTLGCVLFCLQHRGLLVHVLVSSYLLYMVFLFWFSVHIHLHVGGGTLFKIYIPLVIFVLC